MNVKVLLRKFGHSDSELEWSGFVTNDNKVYTEGFTYSSGMVKKLTHF